MTVAAVLLRAASLVVPPDRRDAWLAEWRSELWYIPPPARAAVALGAFRDALWLRRHRPPGPRLVSPVRCLAWLATVSAAALLLTLCLPAPHLMGMSRLKIRDLPTGFAAMFLLSSLLLVATRLVIGPPPAAPRPLSVAIRLRNAAFLLAKFLLVQPVLLCGFVVLVQLVRFLPIGPQLGVCGAWHLSLRWVFEDQRRRCAVCLRRLAAPVRIGSASDTFLEWYGDESVCSRGHGLLHHPDRSAAYCASSKWLRLDPSWTGLFPRSPRA